MKFKRFISLLAVLAICFGLVGCECEHTDANYDGLCDECEEVLKELPENGNTVGALCYTYDLALVDGSGAVNVKNLRGKVVVINFWGTWCGPCKSELPDFSEVASEYADDVVVLAIHSAWSGTKGTSDYINENLPNSKIIFAYDVMLTEYTDMYIGLLGGGDAYPRTMILDEYGVITFIKDGVISKDALIAEIEKAKNN